MSSGEGLRIGPYARAVEEALARARGRPVLVSRRDWSFIADWHGRGVPVGAVLEAIEQVSARARRTGGELRSLVFVAPAVEELWRFIQSGRTASAFLGPRPQERGRRLPRQDLARVRASVTADAPLARVLDEALAAIARGEELARVDADLDAALPEAVDPDLRGRVEAEAARALDRYRRRMPAEAHAATLHRAVVDRLRRSLGLPRLAGSSAGQD